MNPNDFIIDNIILSLIFLALLWIGVKLIIKLKSWSGKMKQKIRRFMSDLRYKEAEKYIFGKSLNIGCEWFRHRFDVCADINPKYKGIEKQDIMNLNYKDNEFDTVCALEVLEHTTNPIKAMEELKRVAKNRIIISVPLEPYSTLMRIPLGLGWHKEHYWTITPMALKHYLGKPIYEKQFYFRWYFAVWDLK